MMMFIRNNITNETVTFKIEFISDINICDLHGL